MDQMITCGRCGGIGTIKLDTPMRGCCGNIEIVRVKRMCPKCKGTGKIKR